MRIDCQFKMKCFRKSLLLQAACLFFVFSKVDAIKCYQCSSLDKGCAELLKNSTDSPFFKDCESNHTFCRTTIQVIIDSNKMKRITRSCGWQLHKRPGDDCYDNDDDFKFEKSCACFTDGCNSSSSLSHALGLSIAAAILITFRSV